nr:MAG TPA: hypothetical protein [Caudoviricetes sp.]
MKRWPLTEFISKLSKSCYYVLWQSTFHWHIYS